MSTARNPLTRPVPVVGPASDRDPLAAEVLCQRAQQPAPARPEVYPCPVPADVPHLVVGAQCDQEAGTGSTVVELPEAGAGR
ncbi:MAG: hypothetical protein M3291_13700 [Actinomycetota bacterium]|nr:hypothetical protein [Actinomycetota bacterium]